MPANFSVKNVPDEVAQRLRERAARNHRSLQRELLSLLEQAVSYDSMDLRRSQDPGTGSGARTVEEFVAELREIFPQPRPGGASAAALIRQMRDARYSEAPTKARRTP